MNEGTNKTETASEAKLETQVIPLATKVKKYVEAKIIIEPKERIPYCLWRDLPKTEQLKI